MPPPPFLVMLPGAIDCMPEAERFRIAVALTELKKHDSAPMCLRISKHDDVSEPTRVELVGIDALDRALTESGPNYVQKMLGDSASVAELVQKEWMEETRIMYVFGVLMNGRIDASVGLDIAHMIQLFSDKAARINFQRQELAYYNVMRGIQEDPSMRDALTQAIQSDEPIALCVCNFPFFLPIESFIDRLRESEPRSKWPAIREGELSIWRRGGIRVFMSLPEFEAYAVSRASLVERIQTLAAAQV
jgi:hypothetical protein